MLDDDGVGLGQVAHAHGAGVALHDRQQAGDGAVGELGGAVEAELVDVQADQVQLRLEVVAEAQDARAALGEPLVGNGLELVRVEASAVVLGLDVQVEGLGQGILELAVDERLLAGAE